MEDYYLVDAKQEYTSYLISTLAPSMYTGIKDLFEQSKKIKNGNSVFKNFQLLLSNIPEWSNHLLEKEVSDICKETGCDWLDNLITAVFVSHSKILTSVKVGNYKPKNKKIDLKIPDTASFIHQCYIQAAREFYKNPMLLLDDQKIVRPDEIIKNQHMIQSIIKESITNTIRRLLPFRNILSEYLSLTEGNNTIYIGNTSIGGSIVQANTIPIQQIMPVPAPSVAPSLPPEKEELTVQEKIKPVKNEIKSISVQTIEKYDSSSESEEKESPMIGKELNLIDLPKAKNKKIIKSVKKIKQVEPLEEPSLNSEMLHDFVDTIKEEFAGKEQSSLNLDNLSFLKYEKKDDELNLDNFSLDSEKAPEKEVILKAKEVIKELDNFSLDSEKGGDKDLEPFNLDNISLGLQEIPDKNKNKELDIIKDKYIENRLVPYGTQMKEQNETLDLEKITNILKEEGTIINVPITKPAFPLNNIVPAIRDKSIDFSHKQASLNNIKKISIKYTSSAPKKKKVKKTTLLDKADDTDSSEMVFK
jgi:hypothetical protein